MTEIEGEDDGVLSVEFFAAKGADAGGAHVGLIMTVPHKCGLRQADALKVDGLMMMVLREKSILAIDMPELTEGVRAKLVMLAEKSKQLPVAEFMARGLADSYFLDVVIGG